MTEILQQVKHLLTIRQQIHVSNQLNETGKIDPDMLNGFIAIRKQNLSEEQCNKFTDFMAEHSFKLKPEETILQVNGNQVTIAANFGDDYITNYKIVDKNRIRHGEETRSKSKDEYNITMYQDGKDFDMRFYSHGLVFTFNSTTKSFEFNEDEFNLEKLPKSDKPNKFLQFRYALADAIKNPINQMVDIKKLPHYKTEYFSLWISEFSARRGYHVIKDNDAYQLHSQFW